MWYRGVNRSAVDYRTDVTRRGTLYRVAPSTTRGNVQRECQARRDLQRQVLLSRLHIPLN